MRRSILAALAASGCAAPSAATESPAPAAAVHQHTTSAPATGHDAGLATQLAKARLATAKYATNRRAAKADGYQIITPMIPNMGWHPDLVTLHLWLWYPNPDGLYSGTNPYIQPFNRR
jgi:hypothetical protein